MPVFVAEDSILLAKMIEEALHKSGYINVRMFPNGQELWNALVEAKQKGNLRSTCSLVITDLEMPQMDGHRLIKLIKEDSETKVIPVIIFSSLITEEMRVKGKALGADEQLSKPEIAHLVNVMDHLLMNK